MNRTEDRPMRVRTNRGRMLRQLHARNAWVLVFLAVSGLALYAPPMRAWLGEGRVWLKQLHIWAGLVSLALLLLYLPLMKKHLRQLSGRTGQQANLAVVLALLIGWILSGLILWRFRSFTPVWNERALFLHDAFTWIGLPYALYHSISRSRWVKLADTGRKDLVGPVQGSISQAAGKVPGNGAAGAMKAEVGTAEAGGTGDEAAGAGAVGVGVAAAGATEAGVTGCEAAGAGAVGAGVAADGAAGPAPSRLPVPEEVGLYSMEQRRSIPVLSRRRFLRIGAGAALIALVGPAFYNWLRSAWGAGGGVAAQLSSTAAEGGEAVPSPLPVPLPESSPAIGGGAKGSFRIYTVTKMPAFQQDRWAFRIDGLVDRPANWNWNEFQAIPRQVKVSDFHCVTGWSVNSCTWEGIPLAQLLQSAGVRQEAKTVKFYSSDGVYTDSLTLEQAKMEDIMVAVLLDGRLLPKDLGGPVRLIVPKMYAYKSVKWLHRIELIAEEHTGYWEARGYDTDAWVKT